MPYRDHARARRIASGSFAWPLAFTIRGSAPNTPGLRPRRRSGVCGPGETIIIGGAYPSKPPCVASLLSNFVHTRVIRVCTKSHSGTSYLIQIFIKHLKSEFPAMKDDGIPVAMLEKMLCCDSSLRLIRSSICINCWLMP